MQLSIQKLGVRVAQVHFGLLENGWMNLVETPVEAEIYKWDSDKDLALLKLREIPEQIGDLVSIPISNTVPGPGADCITIGHPSSGTLWTLRTGDVAGRAIWPLEQIDYVMQRMNVRASEREELEEYLKDAPKQEVLYSTCGLNPGDSGGPLLNVEGELIAVNFAIPSEIRDDKFSFHVHLSEVKTFIAEKPDTALVEKPNSEADWDSFEVGDLTNDGVSDTIVLESESGWGFLVDLDEDSDGRRIGKATSLEDVTEIWDAEFAVYVRDGIECFYDTDGDGEFDLRLIDSDGDAESNSVWVRKQGEWEISDSKNLIMFDLDHFQANKKKFAKPFDKTTDAIIRFFEK